MGSSISFESGLDRKSLKKPDGFVSALTGFFGKLSGQTGLLLAGLGGVLVLSIAFAFWMNHRDAQAAAARNALYIAEKSIETEMKALAPAPVEKSEKNENKNPAATPTSESSFFKKMDVDARFSHSVQLLKAVDHDYGNSRAALDARFKLGKLYFSHGQYDKALPWFQKAADTSSGFEKATALSSLGYTYENLGKFSEAIEAFQKSVNMGEASLKGDALLGIARSYEATHDSAKARSIYDQILKDLPNTEYSRSAELYKSQLSQ